MAKKSKKESKSDLSYLENDKTLKKVEKYVDKNRGKTSQEIIEKKSKRPSKNYQDADLEVMITRINNESNQKKKSHKNSKIFVYIIYVIIMIAILISCIKYFFM